MARTRREIEQEVVESMIQVYCHGNEHVREQGAALCSECQELLQYAQDRIRICQFGDSKGFCSKCKVHCFKPDRRESVKRVMRYSGKRMLLHHPLMALRHVFQQVFQ